MKEALGMAIIGATSALMIATVYFVTRWLWRTVLRLMRGT